MNVGMWMTPDPLAVSPNATVAAAADVMERKKVRRLPVVETKDGVSKLVGILTSGDVRQAFGPDTNPFGAMKFSVKEGKASVSDAMTHNPLTTTPDALIEDVAALMRHKKIGALPVLRNGALIGIVTESDLLEAFISLMGAGTSGVRVTFDISQSDESVEMVVALARRHGLSVVSMITSTHGAQKMAVVRVAGRDTDGFVEAIWQSGHRVMSVVPAKGAVNTLPPKR